MSEFGLRRAPSPRKKHVTRALETRQPFKDEATGSSGPEAESLKPESRSVRTTARSKVTDMDIRTPLKILYVEDNKGDYVLVREHIREYFGSECLLEWAANGPDAIEAIRTSEYDLFLVDYQLAGTSGLDWVREAVVSAAGSPWILLTGSIQPDVDLQALEAGAADYLSKDELSASLLARSIRYSLMRQRNLVAERTLNEVLERSNAELKRLYRTAHQFVDNVSHEFRTPLTVINEFASILSDELVGPLNTEQKNFANTIMNRVEDLSVMVDDMLDMSKIEAGMLSVTRRKASARSIVDKIIHTLDRKAKSSGVTLDIDIPQSLPDVFCDPENIGRVIMNLVVNACKFSSEGGCVKLWAENKPGSSEVRIGVSDNGRGISADHIEGIFDRFNQGDGEQGALRQGFGLGLNIARELVKANFGLISVESRPGKGSTFAFTLPVMEPLSIGRKFLEFVPQLSPHSGLVCLIRVLDPGSGEATAQMERGLYAQLRQSDVVLPLPSGGWVICAALVEQKDAEAIVARLRAVLRGLVSAQEGDKSSVECIGVAALDRNPEDFLELLDDEIRKRATQDSPALALALA